MNNVFLLGAGFSYDVSSGQFPLAKDITPEKLGGIDPMLIEKYGFGADDIEICFTRLELDIKSTNSQTLKEKKQRLIDKLVEIYSLKDKIVKNGLDDIGRKFADEIILKEDFILTTNYDCYLENLLGPKRWTFHGGWGRALKGLEIFRSNTDPLNIELDNIVILKLHGSVNFFEAFASKKGIKDLERGPFIAPTTSKEELPGFYSNLKYLENFTIGPHIILPSYLKSASEHYREMDITYHQAVEAVRKAMKIVIIGSRLRDEDTDIWRILSYCNIAHVKIFIVDPFADALKEKLIRYFNYQDAKFYIYNATLTDAFTNLKKDFLED